MKTYLATKKGNGFQIEVDEQIKTDLETKEVSKGKYTFKEITKPAPKDLDAEMADKPKVSKAKPKAKKTEADSKEDK